MWQFYQSNNWNKSQQHPWSHWLGFIVVDLLSFPPCKGGSPGQEWPVCPGTRSSPRPPGGCQVLDSVWLDDGWAAARGFQKEPSHPASPHCCRQHGVHRGKLSCKPSCALRRDTEQSRFKLLGERDGVPSPTLGKVQTAKSVFGIQWSSMGEGVIMATSLDHRINFFPPYIQGFV